MPSAFLAGRGVVRVFGEEARGFLNGLVTSDLAKVAAGQARFAALLSPQGKILFDFLVAEADGEQGEGLYLDVPSALAGELARRLGFYRLRAKVTMEDASSTLGVLARWQTPPADDGLGLAYADPRQAALGERVIMDRARADALADAAPEAWQAHRIACGVPEGGRDFAYGDTFPHEANMDLLAGVDFDKGCYVGQEVVSRMQHRGTARKRIVAIQFEDAIAPPEGTPASAGAKTIGRIGSSAPGGRALALLRLDHMAEAIALGEPLEAGGLRFAPIAAPEGA